MIWTGTAFRPPRRNDEEGWEVAERLIRAGYRFYSTSQRQLFPRTLRELESWLAERRAKQTWLPEQPIALVRGGAIRWGPRLLKDCEPALVLVERRWLEGCVRLRGDGGVRLSSPVIALPPRRFIPITAGLRVRLRGRAKRMAKHTHS